eukprot:GHVS01048084.1.p1 GENE.GHVS01048084.1~~GHVS01048084.1.p1  ORF type:complete len:172 (+),score=31.68 GHVS01048084.1:166-681(+)
MASSMLCVSLLIVVLCTFGQPGSTIAEAVAEAVQVDETASFRGTTVNSGGEQEVVPQVEENKAVVEAEGSVGLEDSRRLQTEGDAESADETAGVADNLTVRGASVNELVKALGDALDGEGAESIKKEEALDPITLSKLVAKIMKITTTATATSVAPLAKVAKLIAKAVPII